MERNFVTGSAMSSPYRSLHDSYVANTWSSKRLVTSVLIGGSLTVLTILISSALLERKATNGKPSHAGEAFTDSNHFDSEDNMPNYKTIQEDKNVCSDMSSLILVETIPLDMKYEGNSTFGQPLYKAWTDLLNMATRSIDVASFYWSLTGEDIGVKTYTDIPGKDILKQFEDMPSRNVSVCVASSFPSMAWNSTDLNVLHGKGVHVKKVNFGHLTTGVLHTKFWIVDMKHVYIGSANMDWRSLTQVKELGIIIYNCSCLARDLHKIFLSYWTLGHHNATIPDPWPPSFNTSVNKDNPLLVNISGVPSKVYISGSPPAFCPSGRTKDLDAIISAINGAERFIDVAVMEYFPTSRFKKPTKYWPVIDDALRRSAFERHVHIRLLISCWQSSDPSMFAYLRSLSALSYPPSNISIEVKLFIVPVGNHSDIPFARLNHNKYMVTDKLAYIGTSNWSADYFNTTAGVGLIVSQEPQQSGHSEPTLQEQLKGVFERDWSSQFAINLSDLGKNPDCKHSEDLKATTHV
ncbi:5'-3' exonuclease PLD4 isoform X1 [Lepisosteus oculatus]|uniref:Phospholipase D family member 4 n=2 Tax=Lepisosteus oculatus TaxID=7918 RepID=W5N523_LEPOC|nr:PREDICTED: phospholipase D4 isoform X1 [Lepisosteus oculatus]